MILKLKNMNFINKKNQLYESSISVNDKSINEIVVCNKLPFGKQGFKYFTGYNRYFDQTKCMCFVIKDGKRFDNYVKIWEEVSNTIKKLQ